MAHTSPDELRLLPDIEREAAQRRVEPALQLLLVATRFKNAISQISLDLFEKDYDPRKVLDDLYDTEQEMRVELEAHMKRLRQKLLLADPKSGVNSTHDMDYGWANREAIHQARRKRAKLREQSK